jgi:NAD(P)-dependent dehydrogenase (short-subunit alcohol dehydrogenase family)
MLSLKGQKAVVAGGAGAIGLSVAETLRQGGAEVVVFDLNSSQELRDSGLLSLPVDVRDPDQIDHAMAEVSAGGLDILVNAVGINPAVRIEELTAEAWDEVQAVNLRSCFLLTRAAIPRMRERGGGSVVLVSSCTAALGYPGLSAYAASKGGIEAFVRSAACELAGDGIRVNAVAPGTVKTPITRGLWGDPEKKIAHEMTIPFRRLAEPSDVANVVAFLASGLSAFVTGVVLPVDGGLTVLQADFIDRRLRDW